MDALWEVDEDESVETLRVLAVSQSLYNVACDVTVRGTSAVLTASEPGRPGLGSGSI